jgi:FMN phosphatase YigB (HAD superfamily)
MYVGVAGNQSAEAAALLRTLELPTDVIGTSDSWGVEKPSIRFFERVARESGCRAEPGPSCR